MEEEYKNIEEIKNKYFPITTQANKDTYSLEKYIEILTQTFKGEVERIIKT